MQRKPLKTVKRVTFAPKRLNKIRCLSDKHPIKKSKPICRASCYAVQLNRYILLPIGLWPLSPHASSGLRFLSSLSVLASVGLICFLLIPCGLHTFLEESNLAIRMKLIGPMSFCMMGIGKCCSLIVQASEIGECFEHVEADWRSCALARRRSSRHNEELEVMRRNAAVGRYLTTLCAAFMYCGGVLYHTLMPLSAGGIGSRKLRDTASNHTKIPEPRFLAYPVYQTLMHVEDSPTYEIVFFVQLISGLVNYTVTIGACSLAAVFVVHVCGQLEIVMMRISEVFDKPQSDPYNQAKFADIVERHIRALNLAKRVECNLNVVCFIEFVGYTMNNCFLAYYLYTEWNYSNHVSTITYCILFVSHAFNIFIFCYIGELLTQKCKKVGEVAYSVKWYKLQDKRIVDLVMIIMMSSRPVHLTAGKLINLSISNFGNSMKSAATYLNLLITLLHH